MYNIYQLPSVPINRYIRPITPVTPVTNLNKERLPSNRQQQSNSAIMHNKEKL